MYIQKIGIVHKNAVNIQANNQNFIYLKYGDSFILYFIFFIVKILQKVSKNKPKGQIHQHINLHVKDQTSHTIHKNKNGNLQFTKLAWIIHIGHHQVAISHD